MAFQVDLSTSKARQEVAKLNTSIDRTVGRLDTAAGAAARMSAQMKTMGKGPLDTIVRSVNNLNATLLRTSANWGKVGASSTYTSDMMLKKVTLLQREVDKLRMKSAAGARGTKDLGDAFGSTTQRAAAFRAAMYATHTHMGMFTANTLAAATAVYGFVAAVRGVIVVGGEFTQAFAATASVLDMNRDQLGGLESQMLALAEGTKFTATEVAQASTVLARTGMDAAEVMNSLGPTLNLAAIGTMGMAEAADIASNVMHGFQLETTDLAKVVDVLAYTAIKSNTTVKQLGQAMSYAAPVAAATGADLNEVAAMMGVMADSGIKASRAGTAMRRAYVNLLDPSAKAKKVLKDLNIETKDGNGQMRSMVDIMRDFTKAQGNIQDLETLFGVRALAGMSAIWQDLAKEINGGTSKIQEFADAKAKMDGQAERTREKMENNLIDIWAKFKSAISTKAVAGFKELEGALTDTIKQMTDYVINSEDLLETVKSVGRGIGDFIIAVRETKDTWLSLIKAAGIYLTLSKVILPIVFSTAGGLNKIATAGNLADLGFRNAGKGAGKFKIAMAFLGPISLGVTALTLALEKLMDMRNKYSEEAQAADDAARKAKNQKNLEASTRVELERQATVIGDITKKREILFGQLKALEGLNAPEAAKELATQYNATNGQLATAVERYEELTKAVKGYDAAAAKAAGPTPDKPVKPPTHTGRPTVDEPSDKEKDKIIKANKDLFDIAMEHQMRMVSLSSEGYERDSALLELQQAKERESLISHIEKLREFKLLSKEQENAMLRSLDAEHYAQQEQALFTHWDNMYGIQAGSFDAMKKMMEAFREGDVKGIIHHGKTALKEFAKHSRAMFELQKAAAISDALVSAYKGISKTLGEYPYPVNIGLAALHAVAAFSQVKQIQSQSFGSGGGGSAPSGGGGATTSTTSTTTSALPPTVTTAPQKEITIVGLDPDSQFVLSGEQIMTLMQQAVNDGIPLPV